ncbi:MAG: glycosyltransferase family 1 protein, partial [Bacteroidota bacterium]
QKFGIKSVVTIHDLIFKSLPETYPFFDRKMYDLKFRRSCQIADKIIAISAYTKQDIIQVYQIDPAKIEVVYQACDPLFYEQDLPDQSLDFPLPSEFLLYVGSVIPRKNLKGVLEAYAIIPPSDRIPLVVVGGGSETYQQELQAIIQKHALQPFMIWKQNLADNRTLRSLYQKASALIYPSFYEGFGLPVTEALLSRTPAITSSVSSLPEAGGPDAGYVDPNDPEHIAHAIQEVLSDETLRQTMIEKGFAYARSTFDPQRLSQQMMEIYRSL